MPDWSSPPPAPDAWNRPPAPEENKPPEAENTEVLKDIEPPQISALADDGQGYNQEKLLDLFDLFDDTIDEVYEHVITQTRDVTVAKDIVTEAYYKIMTRRRIFWWGKKKQIAVIRHYVSALINKAPAQPSAAEAVAHEHLRLDTEEKRAIRMAILERYKAVQARGMSLIMSSAAFVVLINSFIGLSVFLTPPVSAGGSVQKIAAVQVLILEEEKEYQNAFLTAEAHVRGIAAHYAAQDLPDLTLDLVRPAVDQQIEEEAAVERLTEEFKKTVGGVALDLRTGTMLAYDTASR